MSDMTMRPTQDLWAPPTPEPTNNTAITRLVDWAVEADAAMRLAQKLVNTAFTPTQFHQKPGDAAAAILAGSELGLSPMASLGAFDVIQGRASARAMTLRALVQAQGHEIVLVESTASRCRMKGRRRGSTEWQAVTWTIDRAKQLGVTGKPNWKNQPQAMLVARATSEICRLVAADAILGVAGGYSSEELADGADKEIAVTVEPVVAPVKRTVTRRKPKPTTRVEPEVVETPPTEDDSDSHVEVESLEEPVEDTLEANSQSTVEGSVTVDDVAATVDVGLLREWWGTASPEVRTVIEARVQRIQDSVGDGPSKEDTPDSPVEEVDSITDKQIVALNAGISGVVGDDRDQKLEWLSNALKREITSSRDVSKDEASRLIDWFNQSNAGEDQ